MENLGTILAPISKAVAGALVTALVALLARFGFNADEAISNALEVIVTAVVGGITGYIAVYLAPKNKVVK